MSKFRDCHRSYYWRYVRNLVPMESHRSLRLGTVVHDCLQLWHSGESFKSVEMRLFKTYYGHDPRSSESADWHVAYAMMKGYSKRYEEEQFEVIPPLEVGFEGPVFNPATGAKSKSFSMAGKIDGIIRMKDTGELFILEHKTASTIDGGYIERLWIDTQIYVYALYASIALGHKISGIIYNILAKAKLQQGFGETEEEYKARCKDLIAKSKSGKTSAKRKMPELDDDFQSRLCEWYSRPEAFHREVILADRSQLDETRKEIWDVTQEILLAHKAKGFGKNPSHCFRYNRPCPYFALCKSGGSPAVVDNLYREEDPHQELLSQKDNEPF